MNPIRVLLVEDSPIVAIDLRQTLEAAGLEIAETLYYGEKVIPWLADHTADVVMLDVQLAGKLSGIEVARQIQAKFSLPIIFLTAFQNPETLQEMLATVPASVLTKPFRTTEILAAIELAVRKNKHMEAEEKEHDPVKGLIESGTDLFLKTGGNFIRLPKQKIKWVEADGSYSHFISDDGRHTLPLPLGKVEENLDRKSFTRTHRSYLVNLSRVTSFDSKSVLIDQEEIPLSKGFENTFLSALKNKE